MNIKQQSYNRCKSTLFCFILGTLSCSAQAEDTGLGWFSGSTLQHQISLPTSLEYDTNPALSANNPRELWRLSFTPRYTLNTYNDRNIWTLGASLNVQRNSDRLVAQDREDPTINAAWKHEYELGSFGLDASYAQSSSRISEQKTTGLVFNDGTSVIQNVGANYSRGFSDSITFSITGNYSEQKFSGQSAGLTNFTNQTISPNLSYSWNDKLSTYLQGSHSHFQPSTGASSDLISAVIGVMYKPSERLDLSINGGLNQSSGVTTATNFQGGATASYVASERKTYTASYAKSASGSGIGRIIQTETILLGMTYGLNDFDSLGANYSYNRSEDVVNQFEFQQFSLFGSRDLSANWQARVTYSHKMSTSNISSADGDIIGLSLVYNTSNF